MSTVQKTILSTADVARLFNVTETTVKRWANEGTLKCMKTPGGHRKFEMKHVVEFAQTLEFEPAGALTLTSEDALAQKIQIAILSRDFAALKDAFLEKSLSPNKRDLFVYFSYLYQHKIHLWEIFDLIVGPGMREIGDRWAQGVISIEQEHRASYETLDALAKLQTQIHTRPEKGLRVILACPGEEQHEIGLKCAAYIFEAEGWLGHYLGARTPYSSLLNVVDELRPAALCLSVTIYPETPGEIAELQDTILKIQQKGVPVLIGGKAVCERRAEFQQFAYTYCTSLELLTYIKKVEEELIKN